MYCLKPARLIARHDLTAAPRGLRGDEYDARIDYGASARLDDDAEGDDERTENLGKGYFDGDDARGRLWACVGTEASRGRFAVRPDPSKKHYVTLRLDMKV